MNVLIGSLIIISLFSAGLMKADYLSYELFKSQNEIIKTIKRFEDNSDVSIEDIDNLFQKIKINSMTIKCLLRKKEDLNGKIESAMRLFVLSKQKMTAEQMESYKNFNDKVKEKNIELKALLEKIHNNDNIKVISNELMKEKSDLEKIYEILEEINKYQAGAIESLNSIINDTKFAIFSIESF